MRLRLGQWLFSGFLASLATVGFVMAVGADPDGLLLLLFGGFWIGIHAFLGFVRLSSRLDREARLPILSAEDYERAAQKHHGSVPHVPVEVDVER